MQVSSIRNELSIAVFTDGSCHTQFKTGGWASIIFMDNAKVTLKGSESDTTHQRMELTAVLEALLYIQKQDQLSSPITIYSDSQYVVGLLKRRERLTVTEFMTNKLKPVRNADLVRMLIKFFNTMDIDFVKVKAHLRSSDQENLFNREVDILSRQMMRKHN
jgi:ribonuclease HI